MPDAFFGGAVIKEIIRTSHVDSMWAFPNYCQEVADNMKDKSGRGLWRECWTRKGPTGVPTRWLLDDDDDDDNDDDDDILH